MNKAVSNALDKLDALVEQYRARAERAEGMVAALRDELEERGCWGHAPRSGFVCIYCGAEWKGEESVHGGACRWTELVAATASAARAHDERVRREALEEAADIAGEYREGDVDGVPDRIESAIRALAALPSRETT